VSTPPAVFAPEYLKKFGPNPFIVLDPTSGPALRAKQNGRHGLLIHGGDLNAQGKLRPTFGCVRVFNKDMKDLLKKLPAGRFKVRVDPSA
jgi:lipoprotein-anchoring transpeptidase ErfK/SrfK